MPSSSRRRWLAGGLLGIGLVVAACTDRGDPAATPGSPDPSSPRLVLSPVGFSDLPGWGRADRLADGFVAALTESCRRITPQPADRPAGGQVVGVIADWHRPCRALSVIADMSPAGIRAFVEREFVPFAVSDGTRRDGLFTGYYEPLLRGSLHQAGRFSYPLYRRPADLVSVDLGRFREALRGERVAGRVSDGRLVPYPTREEIDRGALSGRGLELAWVDDPTAAFFLHVQGSGRIALPDGRQLRVGYAGQNGHVYASIGRELVRRGEMTADQASLQTIRAWILEHPDQASALFAHNPSYVFFRILEGPGPIGSQGAPLTARRSMAVDRRFLPLGLPVWIDLPDPDEPTGRLQRLMVTQDTGGAIRGPVRGDVFWGHGAEAERRAGRMKARGVYYVLLPTAMARRQAARRQAVDITDPGA